MSDERKERPDEIPVYNEKFRDAFPDLRQSMVPVLLDIQMKNRRRGEPDLEGLYSQTKEAQDTDVPVDANTLADVLISKHSINTSHNSLGYMTTLSDYGATPTMLPLLDYAMSKPEFRTQELPVDVVTGAAELLKKRAAQVVRDLENASGGEKLLTNLLALAGRRPSVNSQLKIEQQRLNECTQINDYIQRKLKPEPSEGNTSL
jgi:hypothetical protein